MNAEQREILDESLMRVAHDLDKLAEYIARATEDDFSTNARDLRENLWRAHKHTDAARVYLRNVGDK